MDSETFLLSTNCHYRVAINKVIGKKCVVINSLSDEFFSNSNNILIIDIKNIHEFEKYIFPLEERKAKIIYLIPKELIKTTNPLCSNFGVFIPKPIVYEDIKRAIESLPKEKKDEKLDVLNSIVGVSDNICVIKEQIIKYSKNDDPVFIYGESGTGKELVIQSLVKLTKKAKPPVIVDSGCINIFSGTSLFGYTKGAYTGADRDNSGFVEEAHNSCLVLDEVENLSKETQCLLLRFLDTGEYRKFGTYTSSVKTSLCKLITASNISPKELINNKILRDDFFYRISNQQINILPLRDRREDIPLLINYYENKKNYKRHIDNFDFFDKIPLHGNTRELFYLIDHIHSSSEGKQSLVYTLPAIYK